MRYGLISAAFVVFTLSITDFGAPKVIGGDFNVLATDVYKQVIGQQNFEMGGGGQRVSAATAAVLAFIVDRIVQKKQVALLSSRAVALEPTPHRRFDLTMLGFCGSGQHIHSRDSTGLPICGTHQVLSL